MALELPPINCDREFGDEQDLVNASVQVSLSDGTLAIIPTITSPESPVGIAIVPVPPFVIPIINWDFFFPPGRIKTQKVEIQDFYTPLFRFVHDQWGYPLRDDHALQFYSEGVQRQFARHPELAALVPQLMEDAHWILRCMNEDEKDYGFAQRVVNQFLANAGINDWSVQDTLDLWNAIIQALQPLPDCIPTCVTAEQLMRLALSGETVSQDMWDFLSVHDNWQTNVLYCPPAGWQWGSHTLCGPVIQPLPQPTPQPFPQPPQPPGTPQFCPLPRPLPQPVPQPQPQPVPQPQPQPFPQPVPQPTICPPPCQTQIDSIRQCCERVVREIREVIGPQITNIEITINNLQRRCDAIERRVQECCQYAQDCCERLTQDVTNIYQTINNFPTLIDEHITTYYCTLIKPYIDEMCERCKAAGKPPPGEEDASQCETGRHWWGLWAECWLALCSPRPTFQPILYGSTGDARTLFVQLAEVQNGERLTRFAHALNYTLHATLYAQGNEQFNPKPTPLSLTVVPPYGFVNPPPGA